MTTDFRIKTMFGCLYLQLFVGGHMPYLHYLCLFGYIDWCPTHIVSLFCFVFRRLVYSMLPVSLDCQFVIVPSVFPNIYLIKIVSLLLQRSENCNIPIVLSVLPLFTAFDYPFGIFKLFFETTSNLTLHLIDNNHSKFLLQLQVKIMISRNSFKSQRLIIN